METEPQIVFEHMAPDERVKDLVGEELAKLEQFFGRITSAHIFVSAPPEGRPREALYRANLRLLMPGGREVVISHDPDKFRYKENAATAVRDAFDAARRQLQDQAGVMDGKVKQHTDPGPLQLGRVARLMREEGYGFIETEAGHEVFFTRHKVKHGAYDRLALDMAVHFEEEMGDDGPVATLVRIAPEG
jgi:cold shock CspA family protein